MLLVVDLSRPCVIFIFKIHLIPAPATIALTLHTKWRVIYYTVPWMVIIYLHIFFKKIIISFGFSALFTIMGCHWQRTASTWLLDTRARRGCGIDREENSEETQESWVNIITTGAATTSTGWRNGRTSITGCCVLCCCLTRLIAGLFLAFVRCVYMAISESVTYRPI